MSTETDSILLAKIKASNTPHLDALTEKEQIFVLTLYVTGSNSQAARKSGYADTGASAIARRPAIQAALREQREHVPVRPAPTQLDITLRLWDEAHNLTNSGQARISALKTLADIKGMTGGGGSDGDSALDEFFKRAGRAVAAGVFEGVKDVGRKLGAGDVKGVDAGTREGEVVVEAKVVEADVNLAGAFELPAGEDES